MKCSHKDTKQISLDFFFKTPNFPKESNQQSNSTNGKKKNEKLPPKPEEDSFLPPAKSKFTFSEENKKSFRDTPPKAGQLTIFEGKKGCLKKMIFCLTGQFDYMTQEKLKALIEKYGGKIVKSVKKNCTHLVRGNSHVDPHFLKEAEKKKLSIIDELILYSFIDKQFVPQLPPKQEKKEEEEVVFLPIESKHSLDYKAIDALIDKQVEGLDEEPPEILIEKPIHKPPREVKYCVEHLEPTFQLLCEKYRPESLDDLVGNEESIKKIQTWLRDFPKNMKSMKNGKQNFEFKRCLLLSGPPGVGKTTAALIIAREAGYHALEFNASDVRNKSAIENICFGNHSIYKFDSTHQQNTVYIFDEVDGMSIGDKGGIAALVNFIKDTVSPVICICNQKNPRKFENLSKFSQQISFNSLMTREMAMRLNKISQIENWTFLRSSLLTFIQKSHGDLRSALNMIQFFQTSGQDHNLKDESNFPIEKSLRIALLSTTNFDDKFDLFFNDYDSAPDYMYQNLPFGNLKDYADSLESLCLGDVISNTIQTEQNYSILHASCVLNWVIPSMKAQLKIAPIITFPAMWAKQKIQQKNERMLDMISSHSLTTHITPLVLDALLHKLASLIEQKRDDDIAHIFEILQLNPDNVFDLKDIVSFDKTSSVQVMVASKMHLQKIHNESHAKFISSSERTHADSKANFMIKTFQNQFQKRK